MPKIKNKPGRPTTYTPELANEICDSIASSSKGTKRLCKENQHWPCQDTLFTWLKIYPEFSEQYAQAKRCQIEVFIDEILDIAKKMIEIITTSYEVNTDATRGLDYYKGGKGFEIACPELGAQKQICGGGSYEGGIGFAIGIDRLLILK